VEGGTLKVNEAFDGGCDALLLWSMGLLPLCADRVCDHDRVHDYSFLNGHNRGLCHGLCGDLYPAYHSVTVSVSPSEWKTSRLRRHRHFSLLYQAFSALSVSQSSRASKACQQGQVHRIHIAEVAGPLTQETTHPVAGHRTLCICLDPVVCKCRSLRVDIEVQMGHKERWIIQRRMLPGVRHPFSPLGSPASTLKNWWSIFCRCTHVAQVTYHRTIAAPRLDSYVSLLLY